MDITQIRQAIEAANHKFGEAVRKGGGAALGALYTDDAKLLPPNGEMIQGRAGTKAFWTGGLQMGIKDAVLTTLEVLGLGGLVCEIGRYDLTIKPEGQDTIKDSGKYVVVWKQVEDETWKLHVDIWNTGRPA
jgi:ketosteroid isomerase-like protein